VLRRIQQGTGALLRGNAALNAQAASAVLMIRPASFGSNTETAASNTFQQPALGAGDAPAAAARDEFEALVAALRSEGIVVCCFDDAAPPVRPDAVFPNNWVSFHADGTVVLYPMMAVNRRLERRLELLPQVAAATGFVERRRFDLTAHENQGRFLEGTGSLVLDHVHRVAYACRSSRTDEKLVHEWAQALQYQPVIFDATDARGSPYYHTNVMMWIGSRCAAVCLEAIAATSRDAVRRQLELTGRELIELDRRAVAEFAGNMLELASWDEALGDYSVLVMSARARATLPVAIMQRLSACVDTLLAVPVPTIERLGGGSVRCMLAEVPIASVAS